MWCEMRAGKDKLQREFVEGDIIRSEWVVCNRLGWILAMHRFSDYELLYAQDKWPKVG